MPGSNDYSQYKEEEPVKAAPPNTAGGTPPDTGTIVEGSENQFKGYGDIIKYHEDYLKNNPLESDEDRKKRERNEKWQGIISGIGDAVSAVSNLYFTSQYAPNMYDHRSSLSEKAKARWDKAKAERDAKQARYYQHAMTLANLKKADWDWRRQLEQDKIKAAQRKHDNAIADAQEKRAAQLHDLVILLKNNQIDGAKAEAKKKEIEAQYADELNKAKVAREQTAAGANQARTGYYNRGGSGGKQGEYPWYDKDGNLHYARDYGAMRQNAIMHGTWIEEEDRSTVENSTSFDKGKKTETNTTTKKRGEGRSEKPKGLGWGTSSSTSNNETDW